MKQNQWKMEDIQQGNLEKLEKEKKKETKLFLNQIRKRPRFAQIFVDQYSLRDENVNKNIVEISRYLGRNLYEKKNLNTKIEKYLNELEKNNLVKEENSVQNEDSLNKEQILLQEMMLRNLALDDEDEKEYEKLGVNEKQEILNLVHEGRKEKSKEEVLQGDFNMFQTFKQDVIKKETMYKSLGKSQFKNQIQNYTEYSGTQVNFAANTGIVNVNREFYENYRIDPSKVGAEPQGPKKNFNNKHNHAEGNDNYKGKMNSNENSNCGSNANAASNNLNLSKIGSGKLSHNEGISHNNNKFSPKLTKEELNAGISLPPINPYAAGSYVSSAKDSQRNGINTNGNVEFTSQYSKGCY